MSDWEKTKQYHHGSKHSYHRSAPGPGYMDWENQPDPFRRYDGAEVVDLIKTPLDTKPFYHEALSCNAISPQPLNIETLSQLLFDSLAISAWKSFQGSTWALRVNPSSGNLHPTEGYIICGPVEGLNNSPSVSHYCPKIHGLEIRTPLPIQTWGKMSEGFPENTFFIGLSSIYWREAWKYGLRAFRYCNHDVGHALAAINIASSVLGWRTQMMDQLGRNDLKILMGLTNSDGDEVEVPDCLIAISPEPIIEPLMTNNFIEDFSTLEWSGTSNNLSQHPNLWPGILEISQATQKPSTVSINHSDSKNSLAPTPLQQDSFSMRKAIHQRRRAIAMDGVTQISRETFYQFMITSNPDTCPPAFQTISWAPQIHLGLFVHRIDGLPPGLYFLVRNKKHLKDLKNKFKKEFIWSRPEGCPQGLDLFILQEGDFQGLATSVSCGQEIAGKGCFSLGMIGAFENAAVNEDAWMYPRLYWECGVIGQMLYLQSEVSNIRGTGIGCFFDDPVREIFGVKDLSYQSLYHFTAGGSVDDTRLSSLPAYPEG